MTNNFHSQVLIEDDCARQEIDLDFVHTDFNNSKLIHLNHLT